jgi:hypothetical protein
MRLPRVRFTVGRLMIVVAVVAVALAVMIPVYRRLKWLYDSPSSFSFFHAIIDRDPRSPEERSVSQSGTRHVVTRPVTKIAFGKPFLARCSYEYGASPSIPTGLIYRVSVETKLMDASTRAVIESRQERHFLIAGLGSRKIIRGASSCNLTPPRPDIYLVRYEIHVTDMFGREGLAASGSETFRMQTSVP